MGESVDGRLLVSPEPGTQRFDILDSAYIRTAHFSIFAAPSLRHDMIVRTPRPTFV